MEVDLALVPVLCFVDEEVHEPGPNSTVMRRMSAE